MATDDLSKMSIPDLVSYIKQDDPPDMIGPVAVEVIAELERRMTPPPGCVRLPDGRDVKVLGELPMTADGCVFGINAPAVYSFCPPKTGSVVRVAVQADPEPCSECGASDFYAARECYSSIEAAEAARSSKQ